jgi:hypothetical protein
LRPAGISLASWAALLAAALAARIAFVVMEPVIPRDGVLFLGMARQLAEEGLRPILEREQHPLYPALVALVHAGARGTIDWEVAGLIVSVLSSAATVIPLVCLGNRVAGAPAGLLGGWVFAAARYPIQYGPSPIADGLHACLFACAAAVGAAALGIDVARRDDALRRRPERAWPFFAAGLFAGLAYLARPEGLVMAAAIAAAAVVRLVAGDRTRSGLLAFGKGQALLLLALCLTAGPYAGYLSYQAGALTLTRKKPILPTLVPPAEERAADRTPPDRLLPPGGAAVAPERRAAPAAAAAPPGGGAEVSAPSPAPSHARRRLEGIARSLREAAEALGWLPAGLLVIGLAGRLRATRRLLGELYLFFPVAAFVALLSGLYVTGGYTGRRHCYPLVPLLAGWVGLGLIQVGAAFALRLPKAGVWRPRMPGLLTALLVAIMLPKSLGLFSAAERSRDLWIREAGLALRADVPPADTVLAVNETSRVAFYSGARVRSLYYDHAPDPDAVCRSASAEGARWVLLEMENPRREPREDAPAGWTLARRLSRGAGEIHLYRRS